MFFTLPFLFFYILRNHKLDFIGPWGNKNQIVTSLCLEGPSHCQWQLYPTNWATLQDDQYINLQAYRTFTLSEKLGEVSLIPEGPYLRSEAIFSTEWGVQRRYTVVTDYDWQVPEGISIVVKIYTIEISNCRDVNEWSYSSNLVSRIRRGPTVLFYGCIICI